VSRFSIGVEKWRWFVETPCDGGIATSMFQIMVRSSGGRLGKREKVTGEHGGVVVIVEMGDSNDGRADDRDDESKASVIRMSEQGRDIMMCWTSALWPGVSGVLLLCYSRRSPASQKCWDGFGEWRRVRAFA
jgi:hypothetical protein